jgi:F-type H+-transporting ATPase subunit b
MFELNLTLPIFVVMFLVFMKALNAVFLKPVGEVIAKREKNIKDQVSAGQSARQQAAQLIEGYEHNLRETRSQAQALINEATNQVQKERTADLKRIHDDGQAKVAEAKKNIEVERFHLVDKLVD